MRILKRIAFVMLGGAAVVGLLHLISLNSPHPLVRFIEVAGESMEPTLHSGDRVLFVHRGWRTGSIVLADVGNDVPVVKRVLDSANGLVYLRGDNPAASETYWINPNRIQCVMLCRIPLGLSLATASARQDSESAD